MDLSKIIFAVVVLVVAMLGTFTFVGGFSEHYNLTDTEQFSGNKTQTFNSLSQKIYNYSQGTQQSVQNVTAAGGQESSLVAGLWVIPQALGILIELPNIILVSVDTITHLWDSIGIPIPIWVAGILLSVIILVTFLAIGSIIWKYKF